MKSVIWQVLLGSFLCISGLSQEGLAQEASHQRREPTLPGLSDGPFSGPRVANKVTRPLGAPDSKVVGMPVWRITPRNVAAPAYALRDNILSGAATIRCTIDDNGRLFGCEIVSETRPGAGDWAKSFAPRYAIGAASPQNQWLPGDKAEYKLGWTLQRSP